MLIIGMLFILGGCGNDAGAQGTASIVPALQSDSGEDVKDPEKTDAREETQEIDVDLTQLSSTMVYSEVYNMMYTPQDYVGKTVKMNGAFNLYCQRTDENGQPNFDYPIYYACVIADATACCTQGLEFVLDGNFTYPDDYPELGRDITVTGTFETYEEAGDTYCHLVNATMTA